MSIRTLPCLLLFGALLAALHEPGRAQEDQADSATLKLRDATIDVTLPGESMRLSHQELLGWVRASANAVSAYYGHFPASHLTLRIRSGNGSGIRHGVTYARGGGLILINVGRETELAETKDDWVLVHEMIHLAFPSMPDDQHWIEEGISTYVEPVARVRVGLMPLTEMWRTFIRDMPKGEPRDGDQGLDNTHTWGRTYWGGALFCLVADVRIRERTGNRKSLQDALRGILNGGGNITEDWEIGRALALGDKATGTNVLESLYKEMRNKPAPVDLDQLWKKLGLEWKDGSLNFNDKAPEAAIRKAITAPTATASASHNKIGRTSPRMGTDGTDLQESEITQTELSRSIAISLDPYLSTASFTFPMRSDMAPAWLPTMPQAPKLSERAISRPAVDEIGPLFNIRKDGKFGYIDYTGKIVIAPQYDEAYSFQEGLAYVEAGGKAGFIDKTGATVIPLQYDRGNIGTAFSEGYVFVTVNYQRGYIDKAGNTVIQPQYHNSGPFSEGLAAVRVGPKWGYIDKTGKMVIPPQYDWAFEFYEGLAGVDVGYERGWIDKSGKMIIPPRYGPMRMALDFHEGLANVHVDGKWGFINRAGKMVIPPKYDNVLDFSEELAAVRVGLKWGFISKSGKKVIPLKYDNAEQFSQGLANVQVDGKWGFINKAGKMVIPARYDSAAGFSEGLAQVGVGQDDGYIDKTGNYVWAPTK